MSEPLATLSGLFVYPLKSARGIAMTTARIDARGLEHDRRWMVVDEAGRFVSQRTHPRLALVSVALDGEELRLGAPGLPDLVLGPPVGDASRRVEIWDDAVLAVPAAPEASKWMSAHLGADCELVHMPDAAERWVAAPYAPRRALGFADAFPFLLLSEASVADLNRRLERPLPMDRFRPNLVVTGCAPHAEDSWGRVAIGDVAFVVAKPCKRCVITTVDQSSGEPGREPLATLATYRRSGGGVVFGQNLIHETEGHLTLGSGLVLLGLESGLVPRG